MKFLERIRHAWRSVTTINVSSPGAMLADWFAPATAAGVPVNERSALGVSAIYACVKVIAEDLASVPLVLFEKTGADSREEATTHPLFEILGHEANAEMDAGQFVETLTGHVLLRGNAYAEVVRDSSTGRVLRLWPLHPDFVRPLRIKGELVYEVTPPNGKPPEILDRSRMFHLRGLSSDGVTGLSPLQLHAESIGLSIALERHGAALFGNGATPGGVLQSETELSQTTYDRLRDAFERRHQGLSNAHRVAILENGVKWQQVGLQNDHAQFIESRRLQIEEACRIYRIAQIMVSAQEKSSSWGTGIEQMQIGHVQFTIRPWAVRWERAIRAQLLMPAEKARFFGRFRLQALMRGDNAARAAFYDKLMGLGAMNSNQIRALEDENPRDGGEVYFRQQNLVPADSPAPASMQQQATPARQWAAFSELLEEIYSRAFKRADGRLRAASKKTLPEFDRLAGDFRATEEPYLSAGLAVLGRAAGQILTARELTPIEARAVEPWAAAAARSHVAGIMDGLRAIVAAPNASQDSAAEVSRLCAGDPTAAASRELERLVDTINRNRQEKAA